MGTQYGNGRVYSPVTHYRAHLPGGWFAVVRFRFGRYRARNIPQRSRFSNSFDNHTNKPIPDGGGFAFRVPGLIARSSFSLLTRQAGFVSRCVWLPGDFRRARFLRGARLWRCAWALVCGFCLGLGLVLGLGLSRRSSPSSSSSPSRVVISVAVPRFLRGFPSVIPATPGALPTKQTRQNAAFSFVLGFEWCASPVRKFRLYGTIAPRSAFVCHSAALYLPAGVVARSLRFRLVLGLVLVWVWSLKSRVFSSRRARFPAYFRRIFRGYPRPRRYLFYIFAQVPERFRLVLGIIAGFSGCVFHMARVSYRRLRRAVHTKQTRFHVLFANFAESTTRGTRHIISKTAPPSSPGEAREALLSFF